MKNGELTKKIFFRVEEIIAFVLTVYIASKFKDNLTQLGVMYMLGRTILWFNHK